MSLAAEKVDLLELAGDWLNPILIKETRQALKSRQFIVTFLLMLVASWLISVFGVLGAGESLEFGSAGRAFFVFYYDVLALAIFAVVPYTAYRGLLNERDQTTLELLSITSLSPRQLIWGKLCSALVQVFIYYSAIAPFIAFTSMLQGFDFVMVAFVLLMSLLITLCLTMFALTIAAVPQNKSAQGGSTLLILGAMVFIVISILSSTPALLMAAIPFDEKEFWVGISCYVVASLSFFFLFQQIAVAHLTFESDNRSTGIRLACSLQFVLYWLSFVVAMSVLSSTRGGISSRDGLYFVTFAVLHCAVIGFFAATEMDFVSRRVRRGIPNTTLLRLLSIPFLPGGHRGFAYVLLHLALVPLFATTLFGIDLFSNSVTGWEGPWLQTLMLYVLAYLGLGTAIGRVLRGMSAEVRPMHARVIILIFFLFGLIIPYLPVMFGVKQNDLEQFTILRVTNPFELLNAVAGNGSFSPGGISATPSVRTEIAILIIAAGMGLLFNLRPMFVGIREVMQQPRRVAAAQLDDDASPAFDATEA
ncbi:MAG: hypothetical protein NT013_10185 [Planctomycetia bacterium]|nr:hypothetical protein [Planctomycetia bacterium]